MCQPNVKQMIYIRFALSHCMKTAQMEKKKRKVKKTDQMVKDQSLQSKDPGISQEDKDESRLDFGGLPDRNLKKNLGCG